MLDVTSVIGDLSTEVKVGWALWLVWGVILLVWYRRGRVAVPAVAVPPAVRPADEPADIANDTRPTSFVASR